MSKQNKNKFNGMIISLFIAFLIMMFVDTLIGLIVLALVVIINIYKSRYAFSAIKGNKAYTNKDFANAISYYSKAIDCKSVPASIIRGYVILQLKHGNPSEALNTLTDILCHRKFSESDIISLRVSKALALWKCGKSEDSFDLLEELLQNEEDTYIYETLSSLLLINNKAKEALNLLNKALEFDDESEILKSNFAEANFKLDNIKIAEEIFIKLTDDNVQFIEPYYFYAKILISRSENRHAIELLNKALETNDSLLTTVNKDAVNELINSLN